MQLLEGGTIVDADGVLTADVLIDGDTIEIVGDGSDTNVDERIDVSGQFVVPGMIDTHVHLMMDGRPDAESVQGDSEATLAYRAAENLRNQAEAGVVATRDLGAPATVAIDARDAVAVMDESAGRSAAEVASIETRGTAYLVLASVRDGGLSAEEGRDTIDVMIEHGWHVAPDLYAKITRKLESFE